MLRSTCIGTLAAGLAIVSIAAGKPPALAHDHRICAAPRRANAAKLGYGTVHFANTCSPAVRPAIDLEIAKLHSFESDWRSFAAIAARDPGCAIAWWGAAMSARGNPLGGSLDSSSLQLGRKLADHALAVRTADPRTSGLIDAMDVYYQPYNDQIARARAYADRMDALHAAYPDDPDVAAFDGLAIIEGVDLNDKTYSRQRRAGAILEAVMKANPEHPGAPHYLIHAYDYTALAPQAVRAAEIYPTIATASSHANHMPAHIWSMLGRWDQSIAANRTSEYLADPSSAHGKVKGDVVFEHAFDFIAYARLQKGEDSHVAEDLAALKNPPLIVAARYALERGDWAAAAKVRVPTDDVFDAALAHFARAYGAARMGDATAASRDLDALKDLRAPVATAAGEYWGLFVDIYAETAQAWLSKADGKPTEALTLLTEAAAKDDGHEKHIYLENKIIPIRESLADMELAFGHSRQALDDYEASLKRAPNRYRSYLGVAQAADAAGDKAAARDGWAKLMEVAKDGDHARPVDRQSRARLPAQ